LKLLVNNMIDFLLYEKGEDFLLNGILQRGLFAEVTKKILYYNDIFLTSTISFETGSVIQYQSHTWLVISEIQINNNDKDVSVYKARIRKCNNHIITNVSQILYDVPCIVTEKVTLNIDSSTYISTLDNQIYILVQNNTLNSNIKINDIYRIGNLNYSVTNIDDISKPGLLSIKLEFTVEEQIFPLYSIEILNGVSLTTNTETPIQINVIQKNHDVQLTEPLPVVYFSSDELIATIDDLGYVIPVSVGNCVISVSLESDTTISDSISLTVDEVPVLDNFTYTLTASYPPITEVKSGQTNKYTAHKFNNGVEIAGLFDWSVVPGTTTADKYVFTVLNDTQCTIKANSYTYYIDLFATDRNIPENSISVHIKLRSIF